MARIDNTTVYPTVTPAMDDLLIATDVSDNNKTVTFLVSDLTGVATVLQGLQSVLDTGNTATQSLSLTGDINVVGTVYPTTITAVGSTGSAGQILSSTGTGLQWINSPSTSCCNLQDVLDVGNQSTTDIDMVSSSISVSGAGGSITINSPASLTNLNGYRSCLVECYSSRGGSNLTAGIRHRQHCLKCGHDLYRYKCNKFVCK